MRWYDPMITAAAGQPLSGVDFLRSSRDGVIASTSSLLIMDTRPA